MRGKLNLIFGMVKKLKWWIGGKGGSRKKLVVLLRGVLLSRERENEGRGEGRGNVFLKENNG